MTGKGDKGGPIANGDLDHYLAQVAELSKQPEPQAAQSDLPLGQRVQAIRQAEGLSLSDLSQRTGLAEDHLAAIEDGQANPPLGELVKLGKALNMKLGTLISDGKQRPYTVMRVADRQQMSRFSEGRATSYGYSYQALAPQKSNRSMEPFLVTLRGGQAELEPSSHDGEEFVFVMDGELEVSVDGAIERLAPGDSIYYDSSVPHLLRPAGGGPTLILAVIYAQEK